MSKRPRFNISCGDNCPHCQIGFILERKGKFGDFYACDRFPRCAFTQSKIEQEETYEQFMERMNKIKTDKEVDDNYLVFN